MTKARALLGIAFAGLVVTGIWLWWLVPGDFSRMPPPLTGPLREWHGGFVFLSLFMFGYFFADHVSRKLPYAFRYWDGILHLGLWLLLIVSGYLLYYPVDAIAAAVDMPQVHTVCGFLLVPAFGLHVSRTLIRRRFRRGQLAPFAP